MYRKEQTWAWLWLVPEMSIIHNDYKRNVDQPISTCSATVPNEEMPCKPKSSLLQLNFMGSGTEQISKQLSPSDRFKYPCAIFPDTHTSSRTFLACIILWGHGFGELPALGFIAPNSRQPAQ